MIENNLTIMYDNFPHGNTRGPTIEEKLMRAYNRTIAGIHLTDDGYWKARHDSFTNVPHVHGFHHITSLDVYRSPVHQSKYVCVFGYLLYYHHHSV